MIPTAFEYTRAASVKDVLNALAAGDGTKIIAGGHSLLPMMRFRLVSASRLMDISKLDELRGVQEFKKGVRIGALTTYRALIDSALVRERCPIVAEVCHGIGDLQVRNRGTIGGSLAHADPASDMPAVMLALNAEFQLRSKRGGRRTVRAREFFKGAFTTDMKEDELLTDILVGPIKNGAAAYVSFEQAASGYAMVGVCAVVGRKRRSIAHIAVGVTGLGEMPYLATGFDRLVDSKGEPEVIANAAAETFGTMEILGDIHAPADYRRHLAQVAARRAIAEAYDKAGS
jgi:carbon-monoxide dehydrogenase medium subunit